MPIRNPYKNTFKVTVLTVNKLETIFDLFSNRCTKFKNLLYLYTIK